MTTKELARIVGPPVQRSGVGGFDTLAPSDVTALAATFALGLVVGGFRRQHRRD